jgi:hypothetical protein
VEITILVPKGFFLSRGNIEEDILYISRAGFNIALNDFYQMPMSRFKKIFAVAHNYHKEKKDYYDSLKEIEND